MTKNKLYRKLTLKEVKELEGNELVRIIFPDDYDRTITALVHPKQPPCALHIVFATTMTGCSSELSYSTYDEDWYVEQETSLMVKHGYGYFSVRADDDDDFVTIDCTMVPMGHDKANKEPITFPVCGVVYDRILETVFAHIYDGDEAKPSHTVTVCE